MEIEIFTLADFAQDSHSKLTIVGTFDSIFSKQFPFFIPPVPWQPGFGFRKRETGDHAFRPGGLIDADGKEIIQPIEVTSRSRQRSCHVDQRRG